MNPMKKKKVFTTVICSLLVMVACVETIDPSRGGGVTPGERPGPGTITESDLATQNLLRAMQLLDTAVLYHFPGTGAPNTPGPRMYRFYNPFTKSRPNETGSVWMYTSAIEAVNAVLHGLKVQKGLGNATLYDKHFDRYVNMLNVLYTNLGYYLGTYPAGQLISYTQTKRWSVYAVNRANTVGSANVTNELNVYDDQEWLVRELLEAYKLTGNQVYLEKAEYLTAYVLDGWDCTLVGTSERGGIPWGPGYVTKHACSNGPMVSPLVWLHELYKDKPDEIEHRYIGGGSNGTTRMTQQMKKSDYYLDFAKKIYAWQRNAMLIGGTGNDRGVYADMMGGCSPGGGHPSAIPTEVIGGVTYRRGQTCNSRSGSPHSYNSGSMLSGAADLYRATGVSDYLADLKALSLNSFRYFALLGTTVPDYYSYRRTSTFSTWFDGVLMRAFVDAYPADNDVASYIESFQQNLDYSYDEFFYNGFLPSMYVTPNPPFSLLAGWLETAGANTLEGMFSFTYAAEYATLARYEMEK